MEKNKNKIREPYKPEDTPPPPQIIDPEEGRQDKKPVKAQPQNQRTPKAGGKKEKRDPQLGDPTEIDDETTI